MNRRTFILSSSVVAVAVPVAYYFKTSKSKNYNPACVPLFLSTICDEATVKSIGKAYIKMRPAENARQKLTAAVLLNNTETTVEKNHDAIEAFISAKIATEFKNGNTMVVNDWVLTETEARQCALFSLTY